MASGTISKTYNNGFTLKTEWSSTTNISGNYSTVSCTHKLVLKSGYSLYIGNRSNTCVCSESKSFTSPSISSSGNQTITLGTTSHKVNHNSDGKKSVTLTTTFKVQATISGTYTEEWTASGTITLDNIPRQATLSSAPDFNDEANPTISYSNPAGTAVASLQASIYDTAGNTAYAGYRDVSMTGTSYTFNLTTAERNALRSACSSSNSMKVKYYLRTKIGDDYYYSTAEKTLTIVNATPTLTSATAVDVNSTTINLTGSSSTIVKGYSNLRVSNIVASAVKSATLKNVIIDDVSATYTSGYTKTINGYTKNNVGIKVVDSRSNTSSTLTKTFDFVNYAPVAKGNFSYSRSNQGVGETVTITLNGTWFNGSFGSTANTLTASYRFKETSASSWTTGATALTVTKSGNNFSVSQTIRGDTSSGFNIDKAFNLEVIFTDKLSTATFSTTIGAGTPAISILGNKIALGGKLDETRANNGQEIQFNKIVYLCHDKSNTDAMYIAKRTDVNRQVCFGVGSGGTNAGLYDTNAGSWLLYDDKTKTYLPRFQAGTSNIADNAVTTAKVADKAITQRKIDYSSNASFAKSLATQGTTYTTTSTRTMIEQSITVPVATRMMFFGSALMKTSRYTSNLQITLDGTKVQDHSTVNTTDYKRVTHMVLANVPAGTHTVRLVIASQDSGTTCSVSPYSMCVLAGWNA